MAGNRAGKRSGKTNRFTSHAVLMVLCLVLMIAGKVDIALMSSVRSAMTGLTAPVADVVSVPFRAVYLMLDNIAEVTNLREENLRLQRDVEILKEWRRRAELLQSENRQLRSVSGVILPPDVQPVSARVVAVNSDSFAHSVMVNIGTNDGISKGNAVTTTDGLVGLVVDAGPKHAQILLVTDINAMVPVILSSSSWTAATVGRNSALMELRFLPAAADVVPGELLQTSGHGGVLPAGIPVGRVVRVRSSGITVEPAADLQRLGFVTILTGEGNPGYAVDDIASQRVSPLPAEDDGFSPEGLNFLGLRIGDDAGGGGAGGGAN